MYNRENVEKENHMKKLVILGSFLLITSFAITASADELRTYYNQKVPYKAFFMNGKTAHPTKIQKTTQTGQIVQAVVPTHVVSDKEKDKTQKKEE